MHLTFPPNKIAEVSHLCVWKYFGVCQEQQRRQRGDHMRNEDVEYKCRGPRKWSVPGPVLARHGKKQKNLEQKTADGVDVLPNASLTQAEPRPRTRAGISSGPNV